MALRRMFQLASSVRDVGIQCIKQTHWTRLLSPANPKLVTSFHTTAPKSDLNEFFDDPKNWSKNHIQVGRSWRKPELRLKSNTDLHKLWYVLLKERNMLMTMEHFYKENYAPFPNPERIDKVKESMVNLEEVVRERNRAYWELETGESGERPGELVFNRLGLQFFYRKFEHIIPRFMNKRWKRHHVHEYDERECREFLKLMKEKKTRAEGRAQMRLKRRARTVLRRWPDVDPEAFKEQYPGIDIERLKTDRDSQPHLYVPPDGSS